MEHLWPKSRFVQFLYRRTAIVLRYPTIHMYRPFEISYTSVHPLYRIRITAKRIEIVHGTFVTSILIRTVSVQAYSHSSQVSHNTYVQTIWNWLYVRTSTVQDENGSQIYQIIRWEIFGIKSSTNSRCTGVQPWINSSPYNMNGPIYS